MEPALMSISLKRLSIKLLLPLPAVMASQQIKQQRNTSAQVVMHATSCSFASAAASAAGLPMHCWLPRLPWSCLIVSVFALQN
jgi:hypothetical protein